MKEHTNSRSCSWGWATGERKGTHSIWTSRFRTYVCTELPEVQAFVIDSPPPAPPPGWFVFSSAQVCKRLLIWSTLKKILFRDKIEICSLHLCTTQLFQLWFLLLFGTKVNRTTLQNRSVPGMLHARHGHSLFHELPPSAFSKDGLTQFHGQNTHPSGPTGEKGSRERLKIKLKTAWENLFSFNKEV